MRNVSKNKIFLAALLSLTTASCAEFDLPLIGLGSSTPLLSLSVTGNSFINANNVDDYTLTGTCSHDGARVEFNPPIAEPTTCDSGQYTTSADFSSEPDGSITINAWTSIDNELVTSNVLVLQKMIIVNFCTATTPAQATQDPNFGSSGFFQYDSDVSDNNATPFSASRVTFDNQGRIYGVAYAETGGGGYDDLVLLRLNQADGSLDNSFQTNGIRQVDLGYDARGTSIAHANNELYVTTDLSGIAPQVINFELDGELDLTFAKDGIYDNPNDTTGDGVYINDGIVYQSGHNSIGGGHFKNITALDLVTGDPVTSFGSGGLLSTNSSLLEQFGHAMSFTNDQSEFYSTSEHFSSGFKFRVSKHNSATGALVTSFGSSGVLSLDPATELSRPAGAINARAKHTIVHPTTGDIFVMGSFQETPQNGLIYKLDANGVRDNTWGSSGLLEVISGNLATPFDIKFYPSGNYLFLRTQNGLGTNRLSILKLDDQGDADITFGASGFQHIEWPAQGSARIISVVRDINDDLLISFSVVTQNTISPHTDLGIIRICM